MLSSKKLAGALALAALWIVTPQLHAVRSHSLRRHGGGPTPPPAVATTGLTINPGLILTMYNLANQTPNKIVNQLPPDLLKWASFVNIAVNNLSGGPATPYWHLTVESNGCQDITYIGTDEGFCYLAGVVDVCSRRMVGWSIATHLRTELCADALRAAELTRGAGSLRGVIFHSDHGCQYTSEEYGDLCKALGITQSMGTVGDSYDNALAESVWASLKRELIYESHFKTIAEARVFVFEWLNWYNRSRLHSSLGYLSPVEYEELLKVRRAA